MSNAPIRLAVEWPAGMDGTGEAPDVPKVTPGWQTTEFWAVAATIVANVVATLGATGWLKGVDIVALSQSTSGLVAAIGGVIVNGFAVWSYIKSRTAIKTDAHDQATIRMGQRMTCAVQAMKIQMEMQARDPRSTDPAYSSAT